MKLTLLALALLLSTAGLARAQTPVELRAKYGEPRSSLVEGQRIVEARYLVRPTMQLTVRFTEAGEACTAVLAPVPGSTPLKGRAEHAPQGDYMSTAEVIKVLAEIVPPEKRGKRTGGGSMNGGDPEMELNHRPGCWGNYWANFEYVSFSCSSWYWGGTFQVTINWTRTNCPARLR